MQDLRDTPAQQVIPPEAMEILLNKPKGLKVGKTNQMADRHRHMIGLAVRLALLADRPITSDSYDS